MAGGFMKAMDKLGFSRKKSTNVLAAHGAPSSATPSINGDFNGDRGGSYGYNPSYDGYSTPRSSYPPTLNSIPESEAFYQPHNTTYQAPQQQFYPNSSGNLTASVSGGAPSFRSSFSGRYSFVSSNGTSIGTSPSESRKRPPPSSTTTAPQTPKKVVTAAQAQAQQAASAAEVRRATRLLRRLFALRIRVWGTRNAHPRHQAERAKVKQQAEDLVRDLEGMVEEWRGMAAGTWSEEEKGQIEWIRGEVKGMVVSIAQGGFWDEGGVEDAGREVRARVPRFEGRRMVAELGGTVTIS